MTITKFCINLTLVTFALSGCGETPDSKYADFVKVAFKSNRTDLESKGFLCKENEPPEKTKIVCKSYEKDIEFLGRVVTERAISFDTQGHVISIAAQLHLKNSNLKEKLALESDLSGVYTKAADLKEIEMSNASVKSWRRPDGAIIRFSTFNLGMPGLIDDSVSLVAFQKGLGEDGWKK